MQNARGSAAAWQRPVAQPPCCVPASQIAQFAAELERYPQAIQIYEEVARTSVENNLLKYR